jgi:hypothetical protein
MTQPHQRRVRSQNGAFPLGQGWQKVQHEPLLVLVKRHERERKEKLHLT